ncbi:MAG: folate-binding protein [Methylococcales bacterium]|nr:folate-binding protein [Methylococcales bacterium]
MIPTWQAFVETRDFEGSAETTVDVTSNASETTLSPLSRYSILSVSGEDSTNFLQGQTTCDIKSLTADRAIPGAICNPKGRALTNFLMFIRNGAFYLVLPKTLAPPVEKRLRMYVLRSRVKIEDVTNTLGFFGLSGDALPEHLPPIEADSDKARYPVINENSNQWIGFGLGQWIFLGTSEAAQRQWAQLVEHGNASETPPSRWDLLCILNGIPTLDAKTSGTFVPQMFNLDLLGGISFKKGCYTGQEIVARTHYLGKLKRRMYLAGCASDRLPEPSENIMKQGHEQSVGQVIKAEVLRSGDIRLLTVLQIDQSGSENLYLEKSPGSLLQILKSPYPLV